MLALKPETQLMLSDDILIQGFSEVDHYYAFNVKSGDHFRLNHSAYWVLHEIGTGIALNVLKQRFADFFGLDLKEAAKDLTEVLTYAVENNLVKGEQHEEQKAKL